jgi:hypothetical protein
MDSRERISGFLINLSGQTMFWCVPSGFQESLNVLAGLR